MCPAGLQGAVRSRQVYQLKQGTHVGCGLPTLYYRYHQLPSWIPFRWIIGELLKLGELLKFNTANWQAFPLKYKAFDKYNTSTTKEDSELPCLRQQDLNNNILLLNKKKETRNNSGKAQARESFLLKDGR